MYLVILSLKKKPHTEKFSYIKLFKKQTDLICVHLRINERLKAVQSKMVAISPCSCWASTWYVAVGL